MFLPFKSFNSFWLQMNVWILLRLIYFISILLYWFLKVKITNIPVKWKEIPWVKNWARSVIHIYLKNYNRSKSNVFSIFEFRHHGIASFSNFVPNQVWARLHMWKWNSRMTYKVLFFCLKQIWFQNRLSSVNIFQTVREHTQNKKTSSTRLQNAHTVWSSTDQLT
jgi:hypothetical protein